MVRLLVRGGGMHTGGRADNVRICDALGVSPKLIMALETAGPRKSSCSTRGGSNYSSCSSRWNRASSRQRYGHWHIFWLLLAAAGCCCWLLLLLLLLLLLPLSITFGPSLNDRCVSISSFETDAGVYAVACCNRGGVCFKSLRGIASILESVLMTRLLAGTRRKAARRLAPLVQCVCRRWGLPRGVWRRAIAPSLMGG